MGANDRLEARTLNHETRGANNFFDGRRSHCDESYDQTLDDFSGYRLPLIVAILVGGLPMLTGVVIAAQDSKPAFTLDICHPIGGAAQTLSPCEAPLVPAQGVAQTPHESGMADDPFIKLTSRQNEAPTPPPKTSA